MTESPAPEVNRWQFRQQQIRTLWRRAFPFVSGAVGALLILLLHSLLTTPPVILSSRDVQNSIADAMASATPRPALSAQVYEIIRPSMVLIQTEIALGERVVRDDSAPNDSIFHTVQDDERGVASGVIVNEAGAILTSLHVIGSANVIQVTFADGTISQAEVVGTLSDYDVAVLQPDTLPETLVPAVLGNPNSLRIGDEAFVVGHPFGLYGSMSAGVISGLGRVYEPPDGSEPMDDLIQFDAATNPGTSGGPLLNRAGQVMGIVTVLLNPTGQEVFIGIGFAVPITTAGEAAGNIPR